MLRTVYLHGYLMKEYGAKFELDIERPAEAVHALACQIPGFKQRIVEGEFRVLRGKEALSETDLLMSFGKKKSLHIVPVPVGSKNNGVMKVILGVALLGVGFAVAGGIGTAANMSATFMGISAKTFVTLGAGMLLNGLGQMLSPTPTIESQESPASRPSYMFGGSMNLTQEGNVIPLAYGAPWCGSLVLSSGMDVEEVR